MYNICLDTERLKLRPWKKEDAQALYKYASNENVANPAGWPRHISVEMSEEVIATYFAEPETYAIVLKSSGEPVGCIGLVPRDSEHRKSISDNEREIGYWIGESLWGKGLIPEAINALEKHWQSEIHISKLWIITYDFNLKSQRVAEKCGFSFIDKFISTEGAASKAFCKNLDR